MTEKNDAELVLREAAAKDYYNDIIRDLEFVTPARLAVARKAINDFEAKVAATPTDEAAFAKKLSRMNTQDFNRLSNDLAYEGQPKMQDLGKRR